MRIHDITNEAWNALKELKERAFKHGAKLGPQLHIPREKLKVQTRRERRLQNLQNPAAYTSRGNLSSDYKKWENEGPLVEAMPLFIPGTIQPKPGGNKPQHGFWTSTAKKLQNNTYTSAWNEWLDNQAMNKWWSSTGYLYRVGSGALVLPINSTKDAEHIADVFFALHRTVDWRTSGDTVDNLVTDLIGSGYKLRTQFPWHAIAQHFDGVHHSGKRSSFTDFGFSFTYGWDVESTVWLNTDRLDYMSPVRVKPLDDYSYDEEDY